jgi:hypothetical protein
MKEEELERYEDGKNKLDSDSRVDDAMNGQVDATTKWEDKQ